MRKRIRYAIAGVTMTMIILFWGGLLLYILVETQLCECLNSLSYWQRDLLGLGVIPLTWISGRALVTSLQPISDWGKRDRGAI